MIGACIEVHCVLSPGLLESAYEQCLAHEFPSLTTLKPTGTAITGLATCKEGRLAGAGISNTLALRGLRFQRQVSVPVEYKGLQLECGYRVGLVVERELVVEFECVERLLPVHEAQVITYLRMMDLQAGLLVNFHAETTKRGLRRLGPKPPSRLSAFL